MKTPAAALALALLLPALAAAQGAPATARPRVEMVFVIDTTGSMAGLLEGAKQKVWSIVNEVVGGKPSPEIRLGLVAYRDRGDAYQTKLTQLTGDLDAVYKDLMALGADGGGDGPENVNLALHEAVNRIEWSGAGVRALRVVFLVGDAPPHNDYKDVPSYETTVGLARERGIYVNTVRCGNWDETGRHWARIAQLGRGEFLTIDQGGGMLAVATPFDARLAELSVALDGTFVLVGDRATRREAERSLGSASALADSGGGFAAAERAAYRAKAPSAAPAPAAEADLVTAYGADRGGAEARLADTDSLPEELKAMSVEERKRFLADKAKAREALRKELEKVSGERTAWLATNAGKKAESFDAKVVETVRAQAGEAAGITY